MRINKLYKYIKMRIGAQFYSEYCYGKKHPYSLGELSEKNIFYLMTPTYGNMGDQAIEYATRKFIGDFFPDYNVISVNLENTLMALYSIEKNIKPNDFVLLQGGGNYGDLYPYCEVIRRYVIKKIRNNKIVSMPSTLTYSSRKKTLKKSRDVMNNNPNYINLCREEYSYKFAITNFPNCNNILCPDIVFYLDDIGKDFPFNRNTLCACLRDDVEKGPAISRKKIIKQLFELNPQTVITDTQLFRSVPDDIKNEEMKSTVNKFRSYQLVVTDRLHGMILSYITRTPCIVFPSLDKKIIGSYEWIKNCNYVCFFDKYDEELISRACGGLVGINAEPNVSLSRVFMNVGEQLKEMIIYGKCY